MTGIFDGKVAIVTGARTGMGLETAKEFARKGASILLSTACNNVCHRELLRQQNYFISIKSKKKSLKKGS